MVFFSDNYISLAPENTPYGDGIILQTLDGHIIELSMENLLNYNSDEWSRDPEEEMQCIRRLSMEEAQELGWALLRAVADLRFGTCKATEERQIQRIKEGKSSGDY